MSNGLYFDVPEHGVLTLDVKMFRWKSNRIWACYYIAWVNNYFKGYAKATYSFFYSKESYLTLMHRWAGGLKTTLLTYPWGYRFLEPWDQINALLSELSAMDWAPKLPLGWYKAEKMFQKTLVILQWLKVPGPDHLTHAGNDACCLPVTPACLLR